jgi:hypothetical protein
MRLHRSFMAASSSPVGACKVQPARWPSWPRPAPSATAMRASMRPRRSRRTQPPRSTPVSASRRAPRAASASSAPSATSGRSCGLHVHGDVARAEQHRVDGLAGHRAPRWPGSAAARRAAPGAPVARRCAPRPAATALQRVELRVQRLQQRADLRRGLLGEALLEALQRDHAVAVAVLVAGLARGMQLRPATRSAVGSGGAGCGRGGRSALCCAGAVALALQSEPGFQLAKSPSSSRGMKRV